MGKKGGKEVQLAKEEEIIHHRTEENEVENELLQDIDMNTIDRKLKGLHRLFNEQAAGSRLETEQIFSELPQPIKAQDIELLISQLLRESDTQVLREAKFINVLHSELNAKHE
ncbi:hypothetical protein PCE1_002410 [Barthelona sp. PCE]